MYLKMTPLPSNTAQSFLAPGRFRFSAPLSIASPEDFRSMLRLVFTFLLTGLTGIGQARRDRTCHF
jgi:hypothetical protein